MMFHSMHPNGGGDRRMLLTGSFLLLCGLAGQAGAASIEGQVTDTAGKGLVKVPVCLKATSATESCAKTRYTDKRGGYSFKGLKTGGDYSVEILLDRSAAARKFESYRTYVWSPQAQHVSLVMKNGAIELAPFVGKFNFSNYQRSVRLTAADFPELVEFDLAADYVVLKVSFAAGDPEQPPETIFLGQVSTSDQIRFEASVPLSATAIDYEIYSASRSLAGSIALTEG